MSPHKKKKPAVAEASSDALVYLVLDKSGSMWSSIQETIDGVNRFVKDQASAAPGARFYQSHFDTEVTHLHRDVALRSVPKLTTATYQPGGNTALLDAIGRAVADIDALPTKPTKIVLVILTDGQENSSREFTNKAIEKLLAKREAQGWQVLFLGANQDAFASAAKIGVRRKGAALTFQQTPRGVMAAYYLASSSVHSYLRGATATATMSQADYDTAVEHPESTSYQPLDTPASTSTLTVSNTSGTPSDATTSQHGSGSILRGVSHDSSSSWHDALKARKV